jgi:hypothetical protein
MIGKMRSTETKYSNEYFDASGREKVFEQICKGLKMKNDVNLSNRKFDSVNADYIEVMILREITDFRALNRIWLGGL